jgi:hypothetical protein
MESTFLSPHAAGEHPGYVAGRSLEDWNAAYGKVERYFRALRVGNRLLLGQLVLRVLERAMDRAQSELDTAPMELAAEEMERVVTDWFASILEVSPEESDPLLTTRGRMALLLADMPGRWQDQFLKPAPWPAEFVTAMRESFLRAGPEFQISRMDPRPIDLGAVTTLTALGRIAWLRMLVAWLAFTVLLVIVFSLTR